MKANRQQIWKVPPANRLPADSWMVAEAPQHRKRLCNKARLFTIPNLYTLFLTMDPHSFSSPFPHKLINALQTGEPQSRATPRSFNLSRVHLRDKNTARLQSSNPPQSCLRELRASYDGAWNFDTYQRRTFPSCSAPSETSSASVLPPGLSLVRFGGRGEESPVELAAELEVSVFPQLWGATPSSHVFFHQWQDAPQGGGRDRNFFSLWTKLPAQLQPKRKPSKFFELFLFFLHPPSFVVVVFLFHLL